MTAPQTPSRLVAGWTSAAGCSSAASRAGGSAPGLATTGATSDILDRLFTPEQAAALRDGDLDVIGWVVLP